VEAFKHNWRGNGAMKTASWSRRAFLRQGLVAAVGTPLAICSGEVWASAEEAMPVASGASRTRTDATVAIVRCRSYGPELRPAFDKCFDLLGGIGSLVRGKHVTVKLNLTGTDFSTFLDRPVGETYMTHPATASALAAALFSAGARCVRFVESTQSRATLAATLALADWDVRGLESQGKVLFENTRNLGEGKGYSHLRVPGGGYMFSALDLNHAYEETDVMVSLAKLKNHVTAGVTLTMKNLFGITPNSLYGEEAGREDATAGRLPLHSPMGLEKARLPGLKEGITSADPTWRVPRVTADICTARPVHLGIIDGITAMRGGEGPWCPGSEIRFTTPGVLIAGLNPVSTDAVGTAVMGYPDPRATRGTKPFDICDNHLLLAEQAGVGTADLARIDVRGVAIAQARYPYG
jgi:uncharacterized protein (DUF362 family)